jgi:hypothetical protein
MRTRSVRPRIVSGPRLGRISGIMLTGVVQYRLTVIHTAVPPVSQPGVAGPPVTTAHRGRPMFLVILTSPRFQ